MSDIIKELWYGNVDPHEAILVDNKKYRSLLAKMGESRDDLSGTLTDIQKEALDKYDETVNEMNSLSEFEAFRYGFEFGISLMIAIHKVE